MPPLIIRHRINDLESLATVPPSMGIELDLRSEGKELILQHDPFKPGIKFEDFLNHYRHTFMIVNTKEDGLEEAALALLAKHQVKDFLFLDLSFPTIVRMMKKNESRIAVRFSEYEPVEQCLALKGKVAWVWIDCFTKFPLDQNTYQELKKYFKLCLVSPELQNHPKDAITRFKKELTPYDFDAICTKYPELWKTL